MAMAVSQNGGTQIALVKLIFNAVPGVILLILIRPSIGMLERFWPETPEEQASKPKYLHDRATDDADTALQLVEMEQARLLKNLSHSFNAMREGADRSQLPALHDAFESLCNTIREAITDLSGRPMGPETYERLDKVLNLQHSIETASGEVMGLGTKVQALRRTPSGKRFAKVVVEGLDTVLLTLVDVAEERSEQHFSVLGVMTSEDGIGRVRKAYLAEESGLDSRARMQLLAAANHCERLIWLFGEMGRTCMALSDIQKSP
jgi:phosphate:Na+ symporter